MRKLSVHPLYTSLSILRRPRGNHIFQEFVEFNNQKLQYLPTVTLKGYRTF